MNSVLVGSQDQGFISAVRRAIRVTDAQLTVVDTPFPVTGADLLVLDAALPAETIERLCATTQAAGSPAPVIFVSGDSSLDARLRAVRAGGAAFFQIPLDPSWFGETVRELLRAPEGQPYRALVIDDDEAQLELMRLHLHKAGFEVHALSDPRAGYDDAMQFTPDVMFLDISMPGIGGLELLKVLRQQASFTSTQVVLVSNQPSLDAQVEAMACGAQNYLVKPLQQQVLVRTARNNAARARAIRDAAARDPLTGLYNYGHMHELASREFARHKRVGGVFSIALIDMNHFNQTASEHGARASDLALKEMAAHLMRTVRRCDCVGRTGCDQFMLLLQDTDKHGARVLVNKLLAQPLPLELGGLPLHVSFSCGIADSSQRDNPGATISAAEIALSDARRHEAAVVVA